MKRLVLLVALCLCLWPRPTIAHSGTWYVVRDAGAVVRSCPSRDCRRLDRIWYGDAVTAIRHSGRWLKFTDGNGITGWSPLAYFSPDNPYGGGYDTCWNNTWGDVVCAPDWIAADIAAAADAYGIDYYTMFALAACENNFDPDAVGPYGEIGIYQWLPDTWDWLGSGDIWSVADQAYATARALAWGYGWLWTCYGRI